MISEGDRREALVSPSIYLQRSHLRTVSPAEAEPSPCASSAQRRIGQTGVFSPLPNLRGHAQMSTHAINGSAQWPHGQLSLLNQQHPNFSSSDGSYQRHLSKSPKDTGHVRDVNRLLKDSPLLKALLTNRNSSNDKVPRPQQSKATPRSAAETFTHSRSTPRSAAETNRSATMPPVGKRYLDDDQILQLIEEKLIIFRDQMKEINLSQSGPSELDDHISKDLGVKTASDFCRHSPELLEMNSNGAATTKPNTEYVKIMNEAAAICSKKEGESPVVLQAPGCSATWEEFAKQKPSLTCRHTPSHQDYQSAWRNNPRNDEVKESDVHALKEIMKIVNNRPSVADGSKLRESTPTLSALEPSVRRTFPVAENTSDTSLPHSSDDHANEMEHLNQNSDPSPDRADKSSGTDGHVEIKDESEGFTEETQEKEVQTGESKMERGVFYLKNPQYDDLTDDEEADLTAQDSTLDISLQSKNIDQNGLPVQPIQLLTNTEPTEKVDIDLSTIQTPKSSVQWVDITDDDDDGPDDEGPVTGVGSVQAQTSRSLEQKATMKETCCTVVETEQTVKPSPKQHLECTCPIFVETEDGFEEGLCPKCVQDISQRWEGGSEDYAGLASGHSRHENPMDPQSDEDDDDHQWFVVPFEIHDIRLEQDIVVLDHIEDVNEENKKPSSPEQPHQPSLSCFQKLPEFDSLESFYQSAFEKFNQKLPVVDFSAVHNERLPSPNNLPKVQAVEKATSASATAPCAETEDSCDTDDSSDYPLQPKRNRLTPSSQLCKRPQPQKTTRPRLPSESISSNTFCPHDEDSTNNALNSTTVPSSVTEGPSNETSPIKETTTHHRKRKFKSRVIASDSDDDDFNQDKPSKYGRSASLVSGQASTQHSRGRAPSHQFCASGSAESEIPQQQRSITPELSSELLSSNTEDSTSNAINNTERLGNEMPPIRKTKTKKKKIIKPPASASDSVADLNRDKNSNHGRNSSTASGQAPTLHNRLTGKSGPAKKAQSSASVSDKRSSPMDLDSSRQKSSSTTSTSKHRKEQRRQAGPNEASVGVVQDVPEKPPSKGNAASGIHNRKKTANTNASQTTKQSKASVPLPSPIVRFSLPRMLLDGEPYQASSLPGNNLNQSNPQKSSMEKTNQLNSYSTEKSTPAKQRLVEVWGRELVDTPAMNRRRRSSDPSACTSTPKKANVRDHPPAKPRHNSDKAPLLQKSISDMRKQYPSLQPPKERSSENQYEGYKWKEPKANNDLDWERERDSPVLPKGLCEQ